MNTKNLIIGIITLTLSGGLIFLFYKPGNINLTSQNSASNPTPPAGFKEYRHLTYHFSIFYPDNLLVKEYKEEGTAMTVTFQDTNGSKGFQIYVVPYGESQITEQRFKTDVPSGVRQELADILVDGVKGTMFFSQNTAMGETREVWFIKGGFLYEVTTYKELDSWLSGIMQTWKFL